MDVSRLGQGNSALRLRTVRSGPSRTRSISRQATAAPRDSARRRANMLRPFRGSATGIVRWLARPLRIPSDIHDRLSSRLHAIGGQDGLLQQCLDGSGRPDVVTGRTCRSPSWNNDVIRPPSGVRSGDDGSLQSRRSEPGGDQHPDALPDLRVATCWRSGDSSTPCCATGAPWIELPELSAAPTDLDSDHAVRQWT